MKVAIIVVFAIILMVIEYKWPGIVTKKLDFSCSTDRIICAPEEQVKLTCTLENSSWIPIFFLRINILLPENAEIVQSNDVKNNIVFDGLGKKTVEMRLSVKGRTRITKEIDFRLGKRGVYDVGEYEITVGDLLGLTENHFTAACNKRLVVMPVRAENARISDVVGGFLGDISVRRFIMEDPILTSGFADYTGREPMKSISWKRTALSGKLQVKEYDHTSEINVMILVNLEGQNDEEIEQCYRLTRSVCEHFEKKKIQYGLRTNGGIFGPVGRLEWVPQGIGNKHFNTIMYGLGNAKRVAYYSFDSLLFETLRHAKNNENYVVITSRPDEDTMRKIRRFEAKSSQKVCILSGSEAAV